MPMNSAQPRSSSSLISITSSCSESEGWQAGCLQGAMGLTSGPPFSFFSLAMPNSCFIQTVEYYNMALLELYNQEEHKLKLNLLPARSRDTAYYSCAQAELVTSWGNRPVQLYKLVGLASPNRSLLDIYQVLAIPTTVSIPVQLVEFAVRAAEIYLKLRCSGDFVKDFLDSGKEKRRASFQLEELIEKISKMNQEQLTNFQYSQYQPITAESLPINFQKKPSSEVQNFIAAIRTNLNKYEIIPRAMRIGRIKELARLLENEWETQILHGGSDWYLIAKDIPRKDSSQSFTLTEVLDSGMPVKLSEKIVEKMGISLLGELNTFRSRTKQKLEERGAFQLTTDNIILHLQGNTVSAIVADTPCSVDYFHPFLWELGLASFPSSIETSILFFSTPLPNLLTQNWTPIIATLAAESQSKTSVAEFICVIRWILVMDLIYCRGLSQPRLALVETAVSPKQALQQILSMSNHLAPQIQSILLLLQLESNSDALLLENLALIDLHDLMTQPERPSDLQYFEARKFEFLKMMFEAWEGLLFGVGGVKEFIFRSRLMVGISQAERNFILFLLGKFVQLRVEKEVHSIYGENQNILAQEYRLERYIDKWRKLTETAEVKLTNWQTQKQADINSQFMKDHPNATQLFKLLRSRPYQHYSRSPAAAKELPDHIKKLSEEIQSVQKVILARILQSRKENLLVLQEGYQAEILLWLFVRVTRFNSSQIPLVQAPLPPVASLQILQTLIRNRKRDLQQLFKEDQKDKS